MRQCGFLLCILLCLYAGILAPEMRAAQVVVTVTGTVLYGTDGYADGTAKVFGGGNALDGQQFTLLLVFDDSQGQNNFPLCADGSLGQSYNTGGDAASPVSGALQIGGGVFSLGAFPLNGLGWKIARYSTSSCTSWNDVYLDYAEYYGNGYSGQTGLGGFTFVPQSQLLSGDWRAPVSVDLIPGYYSQFHVNLYPDDGPPKYAYAALNPLHLTISGPLTTCDAGTSTVVPASGSAAIEHSVFHPFAFVDCQQKLSELAQALTLFTDRLRDILEIVAYGGTPDDEHLKALGQARNGLVNALNLVIKHCAGVAGATALIAAAGAALEEAAPYLLAMCI